MAGIACWVNACCSECCSEKTKQFWTNERVSILGLKQRAVVKTSLTAKYVSIAATWYSSLLVLLIKRLIPRSVWVVLEPFRDNWINEGCYMSSIAMFMGVMCQCQMKVLERSCCLTAGRQPTEDNRHPTALYYPVCRGSSLARSWSSSTHAAWLAGESPSQCPI